MVHAAHAGALFALVLSCACAGAGAATNSAAPVATVGAASRPAVDDAAAVTDVGAGHDAGSDGEDGSDALDARAATLATAVICDDAGSSPAVDPAAADVVYLAFNVDVIRAHPSARLLAPLLSEIAPWSPLMTPARSALDPARDADWIALNGASLLHPSRYVLTVHVPMSDERLAAALTLATRQTDLRDGADASVPAVPAWLGHTGCDTWFVLQPAAHTLVVAPPAFAKREASSSNGAAIRARQPPLAGDVAIAARIRRPHSMLPELLTEDVELLDVTVRAHAGNGGADVSMTCTCRDHAAAVTAAEALKRKIAASSNVVNLVTDDLLDGLRITVPGSTFVVTLTANAAQTTATIRAIQSLLPAASPPSAP